MIKENSILKNNVFLYAGIFLLALVLRLYMIQLDLFLHDWDERVHALVAMHMMGNPFAPMLQQEHLSAFRIEDWVHNEVWLHKQPLFLWQIALSFKLFGTSEFALRLPSAIMGALSCTILYRIALLSFKNQRIALLAALLWCFSYYQLELISGYIGMDHNDVAFTFYVLASIWAFYEFIEKRSWKWAVAIGVFAGCAILNKWLTGLLVFLPWGILVVQEFLLHKRTDQIKYFLLALSCCGIIFLPWQLYIIQSFPNESSFEYLLNRKHISIAVEGHAGPWYYYILEFTRYFGYYILFFIPIGIASVVKKINPFHLANFIMGLFVFAFFSFVVKTKLPSFIFIVAPLFVMYLAAGFISLISLLKLNKIYFLLVIPLFFFSLNPLQIRKNHFLPDLNHDRKERNTKIYKSLGAVLQEDTHLINMSTNDNIELMFYNSKVISSEREMSIDSIKYFLKKGKNIAVLQDQIQAEFINELSAFPNFTILKFQPEL